MGFLTRAKLVYFDRDIIKRNWKRINRTPLTRAGNLVRMNARESIRRAGPRSPPSAPGTPPRSRRQGRTPPFKMIYSLPQHLYTSVLIGMVGFGGYPAVPGLEEHGGFARRTAFVPVGRRHLKKGGTGAMVFKRKPVGAHYPERPFMRPALRKAIPRLPLMWANSVSRPQ
jgi:hypothetical protein